MTTPSDTLVIIKPEEHGLYQAAVAFMVSERTDDNAWRGVALFVSQWKGDADGLDAEFEKIEAQIKTDFSITAMPSKWRSAKAVARKAFASGMSLLDPIDKEPYGKTLIEHAMKPVPTPLTAGQKAHDAIDKLISIITEVGFAWDTGMQQVYVRDQLKTLIKLI